MQRRRDIQDLALHFVTHNPDGSTSFDQDRYQQALMAYDPEAALQLHRNTLQAKMLELQSKTPELRKIEQGNNIITQEQ